MKIKKMVGGKSISSLKSDLCNKADVSDENNVLDASSDEMLAQSSTDDDVLLIDEHYSDSDSVLESTKSDTSVWKIGSANSVAMHEQMSADLGPELVNNSKDMKSTEGSGSVDVSSNKNILSDHQTVLDYSVKSQKSNIDDNSVVDISDSEDAQIQTQVRLDNKNDEDKGVKHQTQDAAAAAVKDQSFTERGPCTGAESEAHRHSSLADTSLTSLDDMWLAVHSGLPEVSELNMSAECEENRVTCESTSRLKVRTHSTNVNASLVNTPETSNSNEEKQMQLGVSLDKKASADRIPDKEADFRETNSVIVGSPLVDRRESLNDQDKTGDDIQMMDTGDDSKPANSSSEKYTFKNILFMPKDKTTSQKNTAADEESESLASKETAATGKSETTVSNVGETRITQITASDTTGKQSHQNESHMKADSPEQVNNGTANERKRLQTETFSSASKRSKLDSVIANDKVVSDDTVKTDKVVVAEKHIPSTEVKSAVKLKDDKAVLLSNEVEYSFTIILV